MKFWNRFRLFMATLAMTAVVIIGCGNGFSDVASSTASESTTTVQDNNTPAGTLPIPDTSGGVLTQEELQALSFRDPPFPDGFQFVIPPPEDDFRSQGGAGGTPLAPTDLAAQLPLDLMNFDGEPSEEIVTDLEAPDAFDSVLPRIIGDNNQREMDRTGEDFPTNRKLPYAAVCKLYVTNSGTISQNGQISDVLEKSVSTGVLIGPRHVLTVAHNVYNQDFDTGQPADLISVVPGQSGTYAPFGFAQKLELHVKSAWALGQDQSRQNDIALIILDRPVSAPYMPLRALQGRGLNVAPFTVGNIVGYPLNSTVPHYVFGLVRSLGETDARGKTTQILRYVMDTQTGNSGSPIYEILPTEYFGDNSASNPPEVGPYEGDPVNNPGGGIASDVFTIYGPEDSSRQIIGLNSGTPRSGSENHGCPINQENYLLLKGWALNSPGGFSL